MFMAVIDLESENEALRFKVALVKEKGSSIASTMSALSTVAQLFNSPAQPDNQQAETRGLETDDIGDIIVVGSRGMGTTNGKIAETGWTGVEAVFPRREETGDNQ
jgi:hypothetical protein